MQGLANHRLPAGFPMFGPLFSMWTATCSLGRWSPPLPPVVASLLPAAPFPYSFPSWNLLQGCSDSHFPFTQLETVPQIRPVTSRGFRCSLAGTLGPHFLHGPPHSTGMGGVSTFLRRSVLAVFPGSTDAVTLGMSARLLGFCSFFFPPRS